MSVTEQFANTASSTLTATLSAGATSFTVASAAPFPSVPQFRVTVDSEIMLVTAVSGATFTVTRGVEGTTAVSHLSGATVTHLLTAASLAAAANDPNVAKPGTAGLLAAGQGLLLTTGWLEGLNNGDEVRMRLFVSGNMGKNWNVLVPDYVYKDPADTNPYFGPANGQVRDCSFLHFGDTYYTAYTNDYGGTKQQFSIASSTDLLNWAHILDYTVPVANNAFRVRAPEFFVDPLDNSVHILFSFSTGASQTNDQLYEIHTTDSPPSFTAWTNPVQITGSGFASFQIDPFMVKIGSTYFLFFKNANTNQDEVWSSTSLTSGYTSVNTAVTPNTGNYEGGSIIPLDNSNNKWRAFFDKRTDQGYYYTDTSDQFLTWTAPAAVVSPYKWQHGTVVRVLDLALWRHMSSAYMAMNRPAGSNMTVLNNFSVPNNSYTPLSFASTSLDELGAFQASNPTRLTAPSSGWYMVFGHNNWDVNTTGQRICQLLLNGTTGLATLNTTPTAAAGGPDGSLCAPTFLQVGDYVEYRVYQNSGGALNCQSGNFLMMRMGTY